MPYINPTCTLSQHKSLPDAKLLRLCLLKTEELAQHGRHMCVKERKTQKLDARSLHRQNCMQACWETDRPKSNAKEPIFSARCAPRMRVLVLNFGPEVCEDACLISSRREHRTAPYPMSVLSASLG
eukprot:671209-Rhodomonas_salina.2